ncbi:MAG: hypothetical protein ACTHPS_01515, partial [Streptosporangiaceae bacterium]
MTAEHRLAATPCALAAVAAVALFTGLAVSVMVHGGAPFAVDAALHQRALQARTDWLTSVARAVTNTGSGLPAYGLAAAAGYASGRRYPRLAGAGHVLLLLAGQGARLLLAMASARPRPPAADWAAPASGGAFPSGHTTTSALVAALICWAAWRRTHGATRVVVAALTLAWGGPRRRPPPDPPRPAPPPAARGGGGGGARRRRAGPPAPTRG